MVECRVNSNVSLEFKRDFFNENWEEELISLKNNINNYMEKYDSKFVIEYINKNCEDELEGKIINANLLLNNSFLFDDPWDMEQCRIPYLNKNLDWNMMPNGDEEWVFMLNRHEYFEKLIVVYYIKNDFKYLEKLKEFLFNWIDNNEISKTGSQTTRTIDTGIRIFSWMSSLLHLVSENAINDEEILKIIFSIKEQLYYLKESYTPRYTISNWGVLQTTSIAICAMWLKDFLKEEEFENWALDELYKEIETQILNDGSHWEQSVMYHVEVLNFSLRVIHFSDYFKVKLDDDFLKKIHDMGTYLMYCGDASSTQEAQGDSDRSDIRDILVRVALLLKDTNIKGKAHEKLDLTSILLFGREGALNYENMEKTYDVNLNKSFDDSGNIYVRSGWGEKDSFTYLQNGTLGSGHGHADLGHFSLHYNGKPFFIDTGRYTYMGNDFLRVYLKSAVAHNVSVIDDSPFAIPKYSWEYEKYADVMKNYFCEKENVSYVEMAYLASLDDGTPYTTIRRVLMISPYIWIIINDIRCQGKHICKNYYNLDNNVKVRESHEKFYLENEESNIKFYNYRIDEKILRTGLISKNYNYLNNSKRIITKTRFEDSLLNYDIILGESEGEIRIINPNITKLNSLEKIDDHIAVIKEFIISENESYIAIIFNQENFKGEYAYIYEDLVLYGKVIVIHKLHGKKKVLKLKF